MVVDLEQHIGELDGVPVTVDYSKRAHHPGAVVVGNLDARSASWKAHWTKRRNGVVNAGGEMDVIAPDEVTAEAAVRLDLSNRDIEPDETLDVSVTRWLGVPPHELPYLTPRDRADLVALLQRGVTE